MVSFHSLEDRRVKTFLRRRSGRTSGPSRHAMAAIAGPVDGPRPTFEVITGRPIAPSDAEAARNARARSARLRIGQRNDAPAWPAGEVA